MGDLALPRDDRRRRLLGWVLGSLAALAAVAVLRQLSFPLGPELTICPSRRFLHLPCPGCGMTRAMAAIARGDWAAVGSFHPLAPLLLAQAALFWGAVLVRSLRREPSPWPPLPQPLVVANLVALLAVWLVRLVTGTLPY